MTLHSFLLFLLSVSFVRFRQIYLLIQTCPTCFSLPSSFLLFSSTCLVNVSFSKPSFIVMYPKDVSSFFLLVVRIWISRINDSPREKEETGLRDGFRGGRSATSVNGDMAKQTDVLIPAKRIIITAEVNVTD